MQGAALQLRAASAAQGARSRGPMTVTARAVQFRPCIDIHQVGGAGVGRAALPPPPPPPHFALKQKQAGLASQKRHVSLLQGKVKQIVGSTLQDLQR